MQSRSSKSISYSRYSNERRGTYRRLPMNFAYIEILSQNVSRSITKTIIWLERDIDGRAFTNRHTRQRRLQPRVRLNYRLDSKSWINPTDQRSSATAVLHVVQFIASSFKISASSSAVF